MAEFSPKFKEALSLVQKPGRYTGGEPGSVYKDKDKVDVRMAFCFPDTYEIGMSFGREDLVRHPQPPRKLVVRACLHALDRHEGADGAPGHSTLLPGK